MEYHTILLRPSYRSQTQSQETDHYSLRSCMNHKSAYMQHFTIINNVKDSGLHLSSVHQVSRRNKRAHDNLSRTRRTARNAAMWQDNSGMTSLCLLALALSDLGGETCLDRGDGATRSARVASDEGQTVLSLVELGIWRSAGLASNVLHCYAVSF